MAGEGLARSGRRHTYAIYCWVIFSLILLVFGLLIAVWPGTRTQSRRIARCGAQLLFRFARVPLDVDGLERLPKGNHVLLANHTSFLDALVLTAALPAPPGYAFVARQEFRSQALLWPLLRALGTVILHKHLNHSSDSNIELLSSALQHGENLVIFPEGSIERTAGLRPFHSGAFVAAAKHGCPIVLAGIRGARQVLPLKTWQPVRARISVRIGAVIIPADSDDAEMEIVANEARKRMAPLTGEDIQPAS